MGDTEQILKTAAEWLAQGKRVCLATIIKREGSAPREVGAKMALRDDGLFAGSIGGGGLEQEIIRRARLALEDGKAAVLDFDLSGKSENLDSLCGGKVAVFIEPLGEARRLLIFGAGHVGRAVARVAAWVGFAVTVIDDREEYLKKSELAKGVATMLASPTDFATRVAPNISVGPGDFAVVATRGHHLDKDWLRVLAGRRPRYVGMLGSQEKASAIRSDLKKEGISPEFLESLHTPVGLAIGAETPEEIAVSIVGELVLEWRKGKRGEV